MINKRNLSQMQSTIWFYFRMLVILGAMLTGSCRQETTPPVAKMVSKVHQEHGITRDDPYDWLRAGNSSEVLGYLQEENHYTEQVTARTRQLRKKLLAEMQARIPVTDQSVPVQRDDYFYYTRTEAQKEFPIYCRRHHAMANPEEILLDVNSLAKNKESFDVPTVVTSPDHNTLAFAVSDQGKYQYTMYFKNIQSGQRLQRVLKDVSPSLVWANDSTTVFFVSNDPHTLRPDRVWRFNLATGEKAEVFFESDPTFSVDIAKTRTNKYILIESQATDSQEVWLIDADAPQGTPMLFTQRRSGLLYDLEDGGERWFILTNYGAKNFRVMTAPRTAHAPSEWTEILAHDPERMLTRLSVFADFWVVSATHRGLEELRVFQRGSAVPPATIVYPDPVYVIHESDNVNYETKGFRYEYESMVVPTRTFEYDPHERTSRLLKSAVAGKGFVTENYHSERLMATANDGVQIPISLVYRKGFVPDGTHPLLLQGYGAYGTSEDPLFSSTRLSLLDRGFVFAIAHVRGGSELGTAWYENGRLMQKKTTFTDFIAAAEYLIEQKYVHPTRLYARGRSAGGLLVGSVINMKPDLWHGVIADVPFVDVLNTMLDPSIPLTTEEYGEWGDPRQEEAFRYITSYSPYENVKPLAYPNLLVTAGWDDSEVPFWGAAKWVAKLRRNQTGPGNILLKVDLHAGHRGKSGRYRSCESDAFAMAFLLDLDKKGQ